MTEPPKGDSDGQSDSHSGTGLLLLVYLPKW